MIEQLPRKAQVAIVAACILVGAYIGLSPTETPQVESPTITTECEDMGFIEELCR